MSSNNSGFFGSENFRENNVNDTRRSNTTEKGRLHKINLGRIAELSPERWVDIICLSLIGIFIVAVACNWSAFSEALFTHILFPIIYVGAKIVAVITVIGAVFGVICSRFRRRRYW